MSFSSGQIAFVFFFVIIFLAYLIWAYIKDAEIHKKYYKGTLWVVTGIVIVIVIFRLISHFLS